MLTIFYSTMNCVPDNGITDDENDDDNATCTMYVQPYFMGNTYNLIFAPFSTLWFSISLHIHFSCRLKRAELNRAWYIDMGEKSASSLTWKRQRENENEKEWMTGLCFVLEINSYFDLIFITCSIFALWFDLMFTWQKTYIHLHTAHTPLEQKEHFVSRYFFFAERKNSIFCEKK